MFKSIYYLQYNSKTNRSVFRIEDTEFGNVDTETNAKGAIADKVILLEAYLKLSENYSQEDKIHFIAKNLAAFIVWHNEIEGFKIAGTSRWMDRYYPTRYFPEIADIYKAIATKRDETIEKMLVLR